MISWSNKNFKIVVLIFVGVFALTFLTTSVKAKPTLTFTLPPSFSTFRAIPSFSDIVEKKNAQSMKTYSGSRVKEDSLIMIYYHDQAVAVVELGPKKLLISCEVIEIYTDKGGIKLLKELSTMNKPLKITFKEMIKLMNQCQEVDAQNSNDVDEAMQGDEPESSRGTIFPKFSVFSGIIPGTKWCGTGDIADDYHDLGDEVVMDRCCRTHDLCPVKVRAYQKRYDLNNNSIYTKSHCVCDDQFFSCLKEANTTSAQLMGSVYFNLVQVPCVEETNDGRQFRPAREGF